MPEPCPHCGGTVDIQVRAVRDPPRPILEEWLEPCALAHRFGLGEQYVRKLCRRGLQEGREGVRKDGGRWLATVDAIDTLRRV